MLSSLALVMLLLIKNQDAQCTESALIQSIFCPLMAVVVGTVGAEPVLNHLLAACMEDVVQLQRTHSEPGFGLHQSTYHGIQMHAHSPNLGIEEATVLDVDLYKS